MDVSHPKVIELSNLLNALPIHTDRPDNKKFRNPNGVACKLANFRVIDPPDPAKGYEKGGIGDKVVWEDYFENRESLKVVAEKICESRLFEEVTNLNKEEGEDESPEGKILYRLHRTRERNRSLVIKKKKAVFQKYGFLECEVCSFDFVKSYGEHGSDFIECHHRIPLCSVDSTRTKLRDLALVCANCHRMLHRGKPWPSVEQLKEIMVQH